MGRPATVNDGLPRYVRVRRRGARCHYYLDLGGTPRKELPLGTNKEAALSEATRLLGVEAQHLIQTVHEREHARIATALFRGLRINASTRAIPVEIEAADVARLLADSGGRCSLTALPFTYSRDKDQRVRPWFPSVDRIDPRRGYTRDNVRLVCVIVNLALNRFGESALLRMATALSRRRAILRNRI